MADKSITKTELVASIASATGQSQSAVSGVLDSLFSTVSEAVAKGSKVSIPGWISFERVEDTRDGGLALAGGGSDARDELGLGDGLVSHVVVLQGGARAAFHCSDRAAHRLRLVGSTVPEYTHIPRNSADLRTP